MAIQNRIKQFTTWIKAPKKLYFCFVVVAVSFFIFRLLFKCPEDGIRFTGLILQLLGLSVVADGIRKIRRQFGKPGLVSNFVGWVRQLAVIFGTQKPVSISADIELPMIEISGTGFQDISEVPDDETIENKIKILALQRYL